MRTQLRGLLLILTICSALGYLRAYAQPAPITTAVPSGTTAALVTGVIDGDTIRVSLAGSTRTVRLIGIDTPEVVDPRKPVQCYGREASARTTALLLGKTVALEADPSQGDTDKYGRLLRFVWLPDGTDVNLALIRDGYAFEYTYAIPYREQPTYVAAQRAARTAQRGLWSPTTCNGVVQTPAATLTRTRTRTTVPTRTPTATVMSGDAAFPCRTGQIKGNTTSLIYHVPGGAYYARTRASVRCFDSEAAAVAAGYRRSSRSAPLP